MKRYRCDASVARLMEWVKVWPEEVAYARRYREWGEDLRIKQERYERIVAELEKLPYWEKRVVREHYISGRTLVSIAVQIGKSEAWCRERRNSAFQTLKILLCDMLEEA